LLHLEYRLIHALVNVEGSSYETYICASDDFKLSEESKITYELYYELERRVGESSFEFGLRMGWGQYLYEMLAVDYLILNRDRHGANIEILRNQREHSIRLAPLFDHGLSLIFQCYRDEDIALVNPLDDKPVQCFVGSHSTLDNLKLIPNDKRIQLPEFDESLKKQLFDGLDGVVSGIWIETVWNMLCERARVYESICG